MSDEHDSEVEIATAASGIDDRPFDGVPVPDVGPSVDPGVLAALRASEAPEPAIGQLWRLSATLNGPVVLVWVRQPRSTDTVAVVPVSLDVAMADDYSLIVPADNSPLGVDLVLHTTAETTVDRRSFLSALGVLDVAVDVEAVRLARRLGEPVAGLSVGLPIVSMTDERVEFRQQLSESVAALAGAAFEPDTSDQDPHHDLPSAVDDEVVLGELLTDPQTSILVEHLLVGLGLAHPEVRLMPAGRVTAIGGVRMIGELVNVDEVIRLAGFVAVLEPSLVSELARDVFSVDLSVQAMCFAPFDVDSDAVLVNRRTHRVSFTSVGEPVSEGTFWTGPVLDLLSKYFDRFVDPFAAFPIPALDVLAIDTRALAVDKGTEAVRDQLARANRFNVPGKSDGYRRVENHRAAVIEVIRQALDRDVEQVDFTAVLEGEP